MTATVTTTELAKNQQQLALTLTFDQVKETFEKKLREQAKQAKIDGFRPGKVPVELIKKMQGTVILTQVLFHQVEHAITDYIKEQSLDIVGQPLMVSVPEIEVATNGAYTFEFEIGLKPTFVLPTLSAQEVPHYKVEVDADMVQKELTLIQRKFGKVEDTTEVSSKEDLLHLEFLPEGESNETETKPVQDVLLVKYFKPHIADSLLGKKINDSWSIQLDEAFDDKELDWVLKDLHLADKAEGGKKKFRLTLTKIGHILPAELNEEVFKKIFPTEEIADAVAFEEKIKSQMQLEFEKRSEDLAFHQLYEVLMQETVMDLPEAFLKKWYQQRDRSDEDTKETFSEEKFATFLQQLKWSLIIQTISQENNVQVDKDAILAQIKQDVDTYYVGYGEEQRNQAMIELLRNEDYLYKTQQRLLNEQVFQWMLQQVKRQSLTVSVDELQKKIEQQQTNKK